MRSAPSEKIATTQVPRWMSQLETAMLVAALLSVPVTLAAIDGVDSPIIVAIDWVLWAIFAAEFVAPFLLDRPARQGLVGYWRGRGTLLDVRTLLSLAVVVLSFPLLPAALGFVRLVRLARIARLSRLVILGARVHVSRSTRGLTYVGVFAVTAILIGGSVMASIEPDVIGEDPSVFDGIWWAAVTTVGTGLAASEPRSIEAKLVTLALMLVGVALITTLAGALAAHFLGESPEPETSADIAEDIEVERNGSGGG